MRPASRLAIQGAMTLIVVSLLFDIAGENWRDAPRLFLFFFFFVFYFVHSMTRSLFKSMSSRYPSADFMSSVNSRKGESTCEEIRGATHD